MYPQSPVKYLELEWMSCLRHLYSKHVLAVSHRWQSATQPDTTGEQLRHVQEYLLRHPEIHYVWFDYWCMFQDERTEKQRQPGSQVPDSRLPHQLDEFQTMLNDINLLFLGCRVLILLDRGYMHRFWTQFEAWLALRHATAESGLADAHDNLQAFGVLEEFVQIDVLYDDSGIGDNLVEALHKQWDRCNVEDAVRTLQQPDVAVTNESDKETQLRKLPQLDEAVRKALSGKHTDALAAMSQFGINLVDRLKEARHEAFAKKPSSEASMRNLNRVSASNTKATALSTGAPGSASALDVVVDQSVSA